jgi:hypothetical protein
VDLKELADETRGYFESFTRGDPKPGDEAELFYTLKNYRPVWLVDLVRQIHDDSNWLPDDFKYRTIVDVLDMLSEGQDPDELSLEADIYTHDLLQWLGSHNERAGLVDEAVGQMGHSEQGIIGDISMGQWYEKDQIARMIVDALKEQFEAEGPVEMEDVHEKKQEGPKEWSPKRWKPRRKP